MSEQRKGPDPERLLGETDWVRALARRLVADDATADDVLQDTLIAALEHAPSEDEHLRPWLAHVARNFARTVGRKNDRREKRERAVARDEALPSVSETTERLEAHRELVDALAGLAEPYRSTLMLHYFDRVTAADIARRLNVPAATVRWRMAHGLREMRARLDKRYGNRKGWTAAFIPLMRLPAPAATAGTAWFGALTLGLATQVTLAAVLLAGLTLGVWLAVDEGALDDAATHGIGIVTAAEAVVPAPPEPASDEESGARRGVVATVPMTALVPATPVPTSARIVGRFVDSEERGLRGVHVEIEGESTESLENGEFALTVDTTKLRGMPELVARAEGYATRSIPGDPRAGDTYSFGIIELAPGGSIEGVVVDEDGQPIADAFVLANADAEFDPARPPPVPAPEPPRLSVATAADGTFRLDGVSTGSVRTWVCARGCRWTHGDALDVPAGGVAGPVDLVLKAIPPEERIEGVVLDLQGRPVENARVKYVHVMRMGSVRTDVSGRFLIDAKTAGPYELSSPGLDGVSLKGVMPGTLDVELRARKSIDFELQVLDDEGAPIEVYEYTLRTQDGLEQDRSDKASRAGGLVRLRMPSAPFTISVSANGRAREELGPFDPTPRTSPIVCRLERAATIRGRVRSAGSTVPGAKLAVHAVVDRSEGQRRNGFVVGLDPTPVGTATTGADGSYEITVGKSGQYTLLCEAPLHALAEAPSFDVDVRGDDVVVDVDVQIGGGLEGRVLLPDGADAEGIVVGINRFDGRAQTRLVGKDGWYSFQGLTPGRWSVLHAAREIDLRSQSTSRSEATEHELATFALVESGKTARHDLDLRRTYVPPTTVHVTVNGVAAPGWKVRLSAVEGPGLGGPPATGVVDEQGDARVDPLRAGRYRIELLPKTDDARSLPITGERELHDGESTIEVPLECGSLEGVVDDRVRFDFESAVKDGWSCRGSIPVVNGRIGLDYVPIGSASVTPTDVLDASGPRVRSTRSVEIVRGVTQTIDLR